MTFDPARPRHTLPFGGVDYDLVGSMELIEAVEYRLERPVGQVAVDVVNGMTGTDLCKLVSAVLTTCGHPTSPKQAGDVIWKAVGMTGEANTALRLHLYAFLSVCLAPPEHREKKAHDMGELIGGASASPGGPTRKSASAD